MVKQLRIVTQHPEQLIDVTRQVEEALAGESCRAALIYCPHTTAGILVNEHADPDVARDIATALRRMVPAAADYDHAEGNAPAHIKATLVGASQTVPVEGGRLALGTWQGIFLAEFDGPRHRRLFVVPLS